jgi:hypothetical protein
MKKVTLLLLVFLLGVLLPLSGAASVQVDLVSRYIWRGFDLFPDNHAAVQPSFSVDMGKTGLSVGVWSSFALAKWDDFRAANEVDITLTYTFRTPEEWEVCAGFTHYGFWFAKGFTFKDNTSQEIFVTAARTDLPLSPALAVYYDLTLGSGLYVTLGGSHELKLSEKTKLDLGGLIGFNSRQYIDKTGFSDIDLRAGMPLALGRMTLTPSLNVMIPLMDEVNEDVEFWLGFSAAF